MKSILLNLLLLLFIISSCEKKVVKTIEEPIKLTEGEFYIDGTILDKNVNSIYLYEVYNDSLIAIDTSKVISNTFNFKGEINSPKYLALKTNTLGKSVYTFIADDSEMEITVHNELPSSTLSSSSELQKKAEKYFIGLKEFDKKEQDLLSTLKKDINPKTTSAFSSDLEKVIKERKEFIFNFISTHNSSKVSPILLNDNLTNLSFTSLEKLHDTLSETLKKSPYVIDLKTQIAALEDKKIEETELKLEKNNVRVYRTKARSIQGTTPSGGYMSLNSIPQGKVVLVDFWASWCGPCRMINPKLVYLHNKYKKKGLVVLSVSEDKDTGKWISAIAKDNLIWKTHILDKNGLIASSYGVDAIPHKVLLDKQGRIADWKISESKLEARIQELLNE